MNVPVKRTLVVENSHQAMTKPLNLKWVLPTSILAILAVVGAFAPVSNPAAPQGAAAIDTGDTAWMLAASCLVLLMTPGLAFFYGGMVRYKNILNTMLQSFIAMGVVSLLWVTVGFSLAFGESMGPQGMGLVGNPLTYLLFQRVGMHTDALLAPTIPLALFALFQLKFAIITPALVTGALVERIRFAAFLLFIVLFTLFIYCPLAHATWHPNGLLRNLGVLDFAGGTVVHISAGFAALAGAMVLGQRKDAHKKHEPSNIPFVLLGTGMLWFGWFGFNAGSSLGANGLAAQAFLNTNTASAAAMLAWIFFDTLHGKRPGAMGACIGAVVGLVAITPAAGYVSVGHSIFIGAIAAVISNIAVRIKASTSLDDNLDVFPCHGVGGIVGMLLTGVFATKLINPAGSDGLLFGGSQLFITHILALLAVSVYTFGGAYLLFRLIHRFIPLRVNAQTELLGLDLTVHGEQAMDIESPLHRA